MKPSKLLRFGSRSRTRRVVRLFIRRLRVLRTIVTVVVDNMVTHIETLDTWSAFHCAREDR